MSTLTLQQLQALPPSYLAEDAGRQLFDVGVTFSVVSTIVFCTFVVAKLKHGQGNNLIFWILIPISYLSTLGLSITGILLVQIGGAGRHTAYFLLNDPSIINIYLQLQMAAEFIYITGIFVPKFALIALYLAIFTDRKSRIGCWVAVAAVSISALAAVSFALAVCQPIAFNWDKGIPNGRCGDLMAGYKWFSVPNILIDIGLMILPWSTIYHLQISAGRKLGLFVTFLVGSMGLIVAIIRLSYFFTVDLFADPTFNCINTMTATIIEPGAYLICSCFPHLRPLLKDIYDSTAVAGGVSRWRLISTSGSRSQSISSVHLRQKSRDSSNDNYVSSAYQTGNVGTKFVDTSRPQ